MRSRLRLFALVGLLATAVDIGTVGLLGHRHLVGADLLALALAAGLSYVLNRTITFRGQAGARWVSRPSLFAATAGLAAVIDLTVLLLLDVAGLPLLAAKTGAVVVAAVLRWYGYRRILFREVRRELGQRVPRPEPAGDVRVSIVIPAYHEQDRIGTTIEAIRSELASVIPPADIELVVADDGSSDATAERAAEAGAVVTSLDRNRGKGAAVRAGVLAARGRTIVFTDADLAYAPALVVDVVERVEEGWDIVVGSRRHADTNTLVRARRLRELGGRVINLLTHAVLLGNFHDTQCGLKGFRGDIGRTVFERTRIDGFAFDVELFLIAEQDGLSLTEIPVEVTNRHGSSVRLVGDTIGLLVDLIRIRRWAGKGVYRPTAEQAAVLAPARLAESEPRSENAGSRCPTPGLPFGP
ncbi:MAG: glycosyltransferase [Acidimicrobiales bacterium]